MDSNIDIETAICYILAFACIASITFGAILGIVEVISKLYVKYKP